MKQVHKIDHENLFNNLCRHCGANWRIQRAFDVWQDTELILIIGIVDEKTDKKGKRSAQSLIALVEAVCCVESSRDFTFDHKVFKDFKLSRNIMSIKAQKNSSGLNMCCGLKMYENQYVVCLNLSFLQGRRTKSPYGVFSRCQNT